MELELYQKSDSIPGFHIPPWNKPQEPFLTGDIFAFVTAINGVSNGVIKSEGKEKLLVFWKLVWK